MTSRRHYLVIVFLAATFYRTSAQNQALSLSPREQLQENVTQLQANPADDALRTKIIQLALTLDPKPADPPDLPETIGAATYAFKSAQSGADLINAANLYAKAALEAPWRADLYFNEGLAFEKAKRLEEAIKAYQFYSLAAPGATDADTVRENIGALKYQISQQAQQEQEERAKQTQAQEEARRNAVVGRWSFIIPHHYVISPYMGNALEVSRTGNTYSVHLDCGDLCDVTNLQSYRIEGSNVSFRVRYAFRSAWQTADCSLSTEGGGSALVGSCAIMGNMDAPADGTESVELHRQ
ncbi:MAG TPA: tetratricopeptide repeat protein [Terracidiphilus sp.]|nr:tetratricopeptide repeat protein [Terracidiphilus sp.]